MRKPSTIMTTLLQNVDDGWTFKNDNPDVDCYFHSRTFGKITIKGNTINFVDHNQQFNVNEDETSLNDYVAELATH